VQEEAEEEGSPGHSRKGLHATACGLSWLKSSQASLIPLQKGAAFYANLSEIITTEQELCRDECRAKQETLWEGRTCRHTLSQEEPRHLQGP
jgi:hypothetical protein